MASPPFAFGIGEKFMTVLFKDSCVRIAPICVLVLAILGIAGILRGQTTVPELTVIRSGRFFDSEKGTFLPGRDIVVKGNLIEAVGENLPIPRGARVIDLRRFTVIPGLIDAHTHLLYLESPTGDGTTDNIKAIVMEGAALRALHGAARARTFLMAGITTIRDLGNSGRFGDVAVRTAINDGSVEGPRMYVSGPGLSAEGGQFAGLQYEHRDLAQIEYRIIRGVDDARAAVRENVTYGANCIKIYATASPNPGYLSMEEMRAIVEEAHLMGVKVAAHATSDVAIKRAVEAGVDSIEHGYRAEDATLALMKERGVALVPTYLDSTNLKRLYAIARPSRPLTEDELSASLKQRYERIQRAVKSGVMIVAGSDNYIDLKVPQGEAAKRVLFTYRDAGVPAAQVLQWATFNAGKAFGEPRLGVIKTGSFADIIAVEGDPAKDFDSIERVRFVMKNGKVYLGQRLEPEVGN